VTLTHSGIGGYSVFPNPAKDLVYIQLEAEANEKWSLQLTNRQGALLQTREVSLSQGINTFSFDISSLPAGSYFITGASGQKKVTTQFIK